MQLATINAGIVPFLGGDMKGKREFAAADAIAQGALQESGSARAKLYALQEQVAGLPEAECPLQHVFAPGAYARTIQIPAGTAIIGKIHKHQHLNILSQGDVSVFTEGGGVEHFRGPVTMSSLPGTKRAVYAHTDVVWTTIHLTNETDLDKIEAEVIAPTFSDYQQFIEETTMKQARIEVAA